MTQQPGPALVVALVILVAIAVTAALVDGLLVKRQLLTAAIRAVVQLAAVSLVITAVLSHFVWSIVFSLFMLGVASVTSAGRIGSRRLWPWTALALTTGVLPTLAVIFVSGAIPLTGVAIVPTAGIIIGGSMTANSLLGRRAFGALRDEHGTYEAGLSLGLPRSAAIAEVINRQRSDALVPALDQTRTVGLVTLPGAFVGVLLGGGTPLQAGATQILVLIGLLATQSVTVVVASRLIGTAKMLPPDLRDSLVE